MCRIAGIFSPAISIEENQLMVKQMCDSLKHGGPDDEGFYTDAENSLVLGHRRLALIDLSPGGHQPMPYDNKRYWISYNGEIYNYAEIKAELVQGGYQFRTASDTEVILASFAAWGTNAFRRFNGMFAFALWDREAGNLYLVRDRMGIKPLYYGLTKEGLCFSSEIRAFAAIPWLRQANKNWPVYLLAYGHIPEPVTTLQDVRPLTKGSFLRYHVHSGKWDIELFGFTGFQEQLGNREEVKALVKDSLSSSVQRHLISDAPIGVFLSGGLDSSLITILAARYKQEQLKTFSISFEEAAFSEKKYQQLVIDKVACANSQAVLTETEFQEYLPRIIGDMDMPGCDGINTWFISKYAREGGLKAVLSGVGGDELYGGYPSFKRMNAVDTLEHLPAKLLRAGRYTGIKKLSRLPYLSLAGPKGYYLFLRGQFIPQNIAAQLDIAETEVWRILEEQPQPDDIQSLHPGNRASWVELNMYMQNQLLRDADVMSMAHGLEIRVPFLDNSFTDLASNIKPEVKYAGAFPKQLLIDSFKAELPEPVWNRPKMGFTFPFTKWMGSSQFVQNTMHDGSSNAKAGFKKFTEGQMHWSQLMSLLLLNVSKNRY